jgi:phage protein D/phage baseplate assembly protein gpV
VPAPINPRTQTSPFWIKLNGQELPEDVVPRVMQLSVEQDLVLPDTFAIRLRDIDDAPGQLEHVNFPMLEDDRFPIGANIEIGLGREEEPETVLKGEVTSLDLEAHGDGNPLLTVRGYDRAYRLHRERKTRTFKNVTDADLAQQIAREYGLKPVVDPTREVHVHVFQDNQTDWEFLRDRARRVGYELFLLDRQLLFRKPKAIERVPELAFGETLSRVRLRLSGPSQVKEVVVKGWDALGKREIEAHATSPSRRAQVGEDAPRQATLGKLGGGKFVISNQPVRTDGEADALAQSVYDEIAGDFILLEGLALGEPLIRPGHTVRFKNLGQRFDHEYYISSATHRITPTEGYVTQFTVSGRRPPSLTALLGGGGHGQTGRSSTGGNHNGVVVGIVTNNKDDESGGRVKVKFPWLGDQESHWARLATPMAGGGRGFFFLPEVGDEVLLGLDHGDINHAYVIGGLWNGREQPPEPAGSVVGATGKVNKRILKSRSGHMVMLDDSDEQPSITIVDKTGRNTIKLDSTDNRLTISVQGDMALEAGGSISIKGKTVQVEATETAGLTSKLVNVEAAATTTIKGALVKIN